jgi:hypothetical protein
MWLKLFVCVVQAIEASLFEHVQSFLNFGVIRINQDQAVACSDREVAAYASNTKIC